MVTGIVSSWLGVVGLPSVMVGAHTPWTTPPAIAQTDITNEEISQYAQAVLLIDQYRNDAYTKIKDLLLTVEMDISEIGFDCSNPDLSTVPRSVRRDVREVLTSYCNQSQDAVESTGLSPRRFNEITEAHESDQTVFERIQQELIQLQQEAN
jgi:hypothetical protein